MTSPEAIGDRIRRERLQRNMTQRELAERVEVGVPHISKIEAGRENPSDELLGRIGKVFGVNTEELLIVARRLPENVVETLAADPAKALEFLRTFDPAKQKPPER